MPKLTKNTAFKDYVPKPETPMDKTTRIVRRLIDEETEQRQVKIARLRNARLEREAMTPAKVIAQERKTRPPKAAAKR